MAYHLEQARKFAQEPAEKERQMARNHALIAIAQSLEDITKTLDSIDLALRDRNA